MIVRAVVIAALLAGTPQAVPHGAAPRQIADARAAADRLIERAEAGAWFENVTTDAVPTVRHGRSGMTCRFEGETDFDYIRVFEQQGDGPGPGDDVMCNTRSPRGDFSSYATRYADMFSPEAVMKDALAAIVYRFPEATPHRGGLSAATPPGWDDTLVGGFDVDVEGKPKLTLVLVAHKGEWSFKGRATGAAGDAGYNTLVSLTFLQSLPGGRP